MSDWNGLPDQPERSGWHWLKPHQDNYAVPFEWNPDEGCWEVDIDEDGSPVEMVDSGYEYICPCPDPSELAQMRKDERERAAKACDEVSAKSNQKYMKTENEASENYWCGANDGSIMCANAIRALTDDEGKKS
ncbi:hypothetical protein [Komagataeibacter phage phiKX1]|nr:hypothetical protein [Komagataeibacter phage phiKX1]BCZ76177.1 hypothetical protein [Komagataeibacter phage phiKX2]